MKNKKMNIGDLNANANALSAGDLQKLKGGKGDPPPIGAIPPQ